MTPKRIKHLLAQHLETTQVRLFERKQRGDRKTDRHYVQVISTIDDLKRKKTNDTARSKKRRHSN